MSFLISIIGTDSLLNPLTVYLQNDSNSDRIETNTHVRTNNHIINNL